MGGTHNDSSKKCWNDCTERFAGNHAPLNYLKENILGFSSKG